MKPSTLLKGSDPFLRVGSAGYLCAEPVATRIELFGTLTVEVDGRRVEDDLPGRQGRLLFAYLALNRERPVRRDELVGVVWDENPPGSPDAGLAALLTRVRRALGPDGVEGRSQLRLTLPAVWLDVDAARAAAAEAEAALAAGDARRAAERAQAALAWFERPLLPELDGRWVEEQRAAVDGLHSDALESLARAALRLGPGELPAADRAARALIQREPYRESGYAVLMELLAARGNVAEALRVYDQLRVLLRDELGATPAPHVTALNERLLTAGEAPATAAPGSVPAPEEAHPLPPVIAAREERPFVGREAELTVLRRRWARTSAGQGSVVVITGEAGMGKTRLAARFAAEAHAGGAAVLHGRIDEETVVPYQPFVEAIRHYVAAPGGAASADGIDTEALAPLLPELGGTPSESGERENRRYRLFEAVAALLSRAAAERPLLLVVEDLHWAGRPTLLLLRHVVRRLHGQPLLVLITMRDEEANLVADPARLLADLAREHAVERVNLAGLEEADAAELVGDAELAQRLHGRTAGNPFFIEEMLRSLDEAPDDPPGVPEGVKDLVSRRLARLDAGTVETLVAAAVLGRDFRLATLEAMVARPGEELLGALEEALRASVVREDPEHVDRFDFAHALVRETLYDTPAQARRARLHLRAGHALEAEGAPPGELAHHFFEAREVGGADAAVAHSTAAARHAVAAHAYEEAAWHLQQALRALPGDEAAAGGGRAAVEGARPAGPAGGGRAAVERARPAGRVAAERVPPAGREAAVQRAELLLALGDVRWQASEPGARDAFDEAAALARAHDAPDVLARAALGAGGRFYMPTVSDPAYVGRLEEALAALPDEDGALRARLLARLAEHLALADADERPATLGTEAVAMARRTNDDGALAAALMGRHAALLGIEHVEERKRTIDEAIALAERLHAHELQALALHWRIYDLVELGDIAGAQASHARLEQLARELHQPLYSHAALAWRGEWAHVAGRLDEAERIHRESLRIAEAAGAYEARGFFLTQLFAIRRDQGRLGEILPQVERLVRDPGSIGSAWRAPYPLVLLQAGETERAKAAYDLALADALERGLPSSLFRLSALVCLAEASAQLGDPAGAEALIPALEPHADRFVQTAFSGCWGSVRRFLGLLHATAGRPDEAKAELHRALELHLALEAPILVEVTQRDLADVSGAPQAAL
jgi:DNA-binding SARP family transcriptional activator/tetratricopeptide (TPR) repeat protein